ncbi:hypothetical protein GCM10009530_27090 [Microbispora corallina]|uniref:FXSXX-COOH protein n=1 Tax=Microbispora corallina TaxID=83302 RepID=A0ABQ4FZ90_9ACTN|nr:hypothetical protein [Microbispora corallina]GIH40095.1 hypothetical protein Mco01_30950 [Microbispora corallina]
MSTLAEEKRTEVASEVVDLRFVPLSLVRETASADILRRIKPDSPAIPRVPVAAFNSSI